MITSGNYQEMQRYLPEWYARFLEMNEILKSTGKVVDDIFTQMLNMENDLNICTASETGLAIWERILDLKVTDYIASSLEERRSLVLSKYRGIQKFDASGIKIIAEAYKNGMVDVWFDTDTICIKYSGLYGIPETFMDFEKIIKALRPAHLQVLFLYKYYLVKEVHQKMTISQLQTLKIDTLGRRKEYAN